MQWVWYSARWSVIKTGCTIWICACWVSSPSVFWFRSWTRSLSGTHYPIPHTTSACLKKKKDHQKKTAKLASFSVEEPSYWQWDILTTLSESADIHRNFIYGWNQNMCAGVNGSDSALYGCGFPIVNRLLPTVIIPSHSRHFNVTVAGACATTPELKERCPKGATCDEVYGREYCRHGVAWLLFVR